MNIALDHLYLRQEQPYWEYGCDYTHFVTVMKNLRSDYDYLWMLNISWVKKENYLVFYHFIDLNNFNKFIVRVEIPSQGKLVSIRELWKNAISYETEIVNETTLEFQEDSKFFTEQSKDYNLLKEYDLESHLNLQKNNFNIQLKMLGDDVYGCHTSRGLFRIGIEDIARQVESKKVFHLIENYFPLRSVTNATLISTAFEESNQITVPDRAQGIRMVMLELERILNHCLSFRQFAEEQKYDFFYSIARSWVQKTQALNISLIGNEFGRNMIRIGGVRKDASQVWVSRVIQELNELENSLRASYHRLFTSTGFRQSLDYELFSKEDVFQWSLTGAYARSAGINIDLRKLRPYWFYSDVDFEVPLGVRGRGYDLFLVKYEEILQSISIIIQVLDNLPTGEVLSPDIEDFTRIQLDDEGTHDERYRNSVKMMNSFETAEALNFIESFDGIAGISILRNSNQSERFRLINNVQCLRDYFESKCIGFELDHIYSFWCSLNINLKEVEK